MVIFYDLFAGPIGCRLETLYSTIIVSTTSGGDIAKQLNHLQKFSVDSLISTFISGDSGTNFIGK